MAPQPKTATQQNIIYPDSDGQPRADNTVQFRWIMMLYHNLAWLFAENREVCRSLNLTPNPLQV